MVNYPNGRSRAYSTVPKKKKSLTELSVTKKSTSKTKGMVAFGKRGMNFEAEINATNEYYLSRGLAVIHKKPTPIQIVKVDYPQRSRAKITEAYFRQASTTDYSGVYEGHYIDFEAKETQQKTVFPLKNFHEHQIVHMSNVLAQGGIAFVLLHFARLNETYLLPSSCLITFYYEKGGLKSIPLSHIRENGYKIETNHIPRIPYLEIVNKLCEVQ